MSINNLPVQVHQRTDFAKKHGYIYVGKGWFRPRHCYSIAMEGAIKSKMQSKDVQFPPVKYNGSFGDIIPQ